MNKAWEFTRVKDHSAATQGGVKQEVAEAEKTVAAEQTEARGIAGKISATTTAIEKTKKRIADRFIGNIKGSIFLDDRELRQAIISGPYDSQGKPKFVSLGSESTNLSATQKKELNRLNRLHNSYLKLLKNNTELNKLNEDLGRQNKRRDDLRQKYPNITQMDRANQAREQVLAQLSPQNRQLFDRINRNPNLSAEQKAFLFEQMATTAATATIMA
tara:strand:- start:779 stop:1426 length:648 start_codon:yes stop_codon:yes gene_type:complete